MTDSFCLGWNGQNISKYSAEGTETNQTIGEKSNSNEETIMTLLRENPRRYMFWPEDTSNKPYINAKTIENNVQAKVDIAEDRIWPDDLKEAVGDLKENVVIVPKTENKPIMGEIKAEPINLTSNFEDFYNKDSEKISANVSVTDDGSNDKEAAINDSPFKIESFFDQLSNKNSVINDFNTQFSNEGSFRAQLSNTPTTTTSTTTSSTTTRITSTTTTTTTTTKPTTMTIFTSISTSSTSTTIRTKTTTTTENTSDTTAKRESGIESFFGQLQEASSSALKSDVSLSSNENVSLDQEEVFLGTRDHNETINHVVNSSLLSRDQNQHHGAEINETSNLSNTDTIHASGSQYVKFAKNNNTAVNLEEEEIRTTIQSLVEETTVFTITNDSTPVPVASVTTMTPVAFSEAETVASSTIGSVTTTMTRRLPSRYMNTRTRTPSRARPSPASTSPPSVINHNMNLQTALIINTLSKVLPNVPQSRLKNQPRLESVGSGVTFHQEEIFIFHTTLTELHVSYI